MLDPDHPVVLKAWDRLHSLGAISDDAGRLTRSFLSPASRRAGLQILAWMEETGLSTAHDALGNLRGRHEGGGSRPPLLIGSHYDTVVDAGKFDGPLGIISGIAAIELLASQGRSPEETVDLLAFADEEGVRFHATYLGSRACIGELDEALLGTRDARGITIAEAIAHEGWHEGASEILYPPGSASAYLELHIEQGRVLENASLALGVVPSICGQIRGRIELRGQAEHAGTTPMPLRRDALAGAAECLLAIEGIAKLHDPLVATVGKLEVWPGAGNSVPGECHFTLDLRHPSDAQLEDALKAIERACREIAGARRLEIVFEILQRGAAVQADESWIAALAAAVAEITGSPAPRIPSGAGHDAVVMSAVAPMAMIFLRCRGGLSHHPDESITREDLALGIETLAKVIDRWSNPLSNNS